MKVLIIGSGGREHALLTQVLKSPRVTQAYVAPGNGGTSLLAKNILIVPQNIELLVEFAKDNAIDLTIVGPELPLTLGIVDAFEEEGLRIFGPSQKASLLEGSKSFTKEFCRELGIPTADFQTFTDADTAKKYMRKKNQFPIVIKADGLAEGKGVMMAQNLIEAEAAIKRIFQTLGEAGQKIVIEEFLQGEEASFIVMTDGTSYLELPGSQDHKRVFDNDEGPNTGGMGAYAPAPILTESVRAKVRTQIIEPTLRNMKEKEREYKGFLYAGLMIANGEPKLVEYNCRLGDPEAQVVLPLIESDFVNLIEAALDHKLNQVKLKISSQSCAGIVLASEGYPGDYKKNILIEGLDEISDPDVTVNHAGTKILDEILVTNGGRVLTVSARGSTLKEATALAYENVAKVHFEGMHFRHDIGARALKS